MKTKTRRLATMSLSALIVLSSVAAAVAQFTAQTRAVRPASVSGDMLEMLYANDDRLDTRATSANTRYIGVSLTIDVGSEQNVVGINQDHKRWPTHFPGAYKVEVAASASGPWMLVWEGPGMRGESRAAFEAIRARFIRVTATALNTQYNEDWSIAELRVAIDPGQTARRIPPPEPEKKAIEPTRAPGLLRDIPLAFDKNPDTRATSGTADYEGMVLNFDLGGEYELSRVAQLHGRWADDYPAKYKIEVSRERNENKFREVWSGRGEPGRSVARFDTVVTRYVRITALVKRDREHWWSIAELRNNRDEDVIEDDDRANRPIREITSQGLSNINAVIDDNDRTRATTGTPNYEGSWVQADLGGSYTVFRVVQVHNPDAGDYPGRYRIEVSPDGKKWQAVFEGRGEPGRSATSFTPVRARFIRITALSNRDNRQWWSIYKLRVIG